jgi:uncharacterized phage infection (PIP) family protein YhgE
MRISRRAAGWLLVAYAIVGFTLVVLGGLVGLDAAGRFERLSTDADAAITSAAAATQAAADSFTNIDASLDESRSSADAAAALARDASGTLGSLATAMSLSVFGAQPLLPLAAEFTTSAEQATALAETLDQVGASLGDTRTDVARIGPQLEQLSAQLERLGSGSEPAASTPPLRIFVLVLLSWLLMQAVGSLLAGLTLMRSARTP